MFRSVLAALALAGVASSQAAVPLPALVIDGSQTTVSGLSSGAFMAVQMHVAYSATFHTGAGIVAGGPYYCAQDSLATATGPCMAHTSAIPVASLVATTKSWANSGAIDPVANLANSKLYLYSGTQDETVVQAVMNDLKTYYASFVPAASTVYKNTIGSGHGMITDDFGGTCATTASPYVDDCNFDLAGALLQQLYGTLAPRNAGALSGNFVQFDQTAFVSGHGMASTGWLYVPADCAAGATCRLHVALHGCLQNAGDVGQQFVRDTGYNRWADTNHIVVMYPQTGAATAANPNGCWDWWGYDSASYAKKNGPQMAAVKAMVDHVSGGTPPAAPATLPAASGTRDPARRQRRHGLRRDEHVGQARVERGRRRGGLRRVARPDEDQRRAADDDVGHRHRPRARHAVSLGRQGRRERRCRRAVVGGRRRDDDRQRVAVLHRQQLRADARRPRIRAVRLRVCRRVERADGPVEHLPEFDAEADGAGLVRRRDLLLKSLGAEGASNARGSGLASGFRCQAGSKT